MKRSRTWVWFFVVVAALTAVAVGIEIWFNLSQQLTPAQLAAARAAWNERAPAEFEVEYLLDRKGRGPLHYRATVRHREVTAVTLDGQEVEPVLFPLHDLPPLFEEVSAWLADDPSRSDGEVDYVAPADAATYRVRVSRGQVTVTRNGQALPATLAESYLPAAQLSAFARQLELDVRPGSGRIFCVATFDRKTGMPLRYVRSVSATREHVQIVVTDR